jgi:hypothetical protein
VIIVVVQKERLRTTVGVHCCLTLTGDPMFLVAGFMVTMFLAPAADVVVDCRRDIRIRRRQRVLKREDGSNKVYAKSSEKKG